MEYVHEHLIGFIILGLSFVLTTGMLIFAWVKWKKRWDVDKFHGILVRFDRGATFTQEIGEELSKANKAIKDTIAKHWPDNPELLDYRVEVVPPGEVRTPTVPAGKLRDGSGVGGSIRTERYLPITKKYWVAVVVNERTGAFIAHEVLAHIVHARLTGSANTHDPSTGKYYDPKVLEIENEAKALI